MYLSKDYCKLELKLKSIFCLLYHGIDFHESIVHHIRSAEARPLTAAYVTKVSCLSTLPHKI